MTSCICGRCVRRDRKLYIHSSSTENGKCCHFLYSSWKCSEKWAPSLCGWKLVPLLRRLLEFLFFVRKYRNNKHCRALQRLRRRVKVIRAGCLVLIFCREILSRPVNTNTRRKPVFQLAKINWGQVKFCHSFMLAKALRQRVTDSFSACLTMLECAIA